jgi:hypothetical protein
MFGHMYGPYRWPMYGPFSSFSGIFFLVLAVILAIGVLYVLTLRRALLRCAPQNRAVEPDTAWLLFIPLFNLFWAFVLYPRISESLEREFRRRGLPIEANPAKSLGLSLAILHACSAVPLVNIVTGLPTLIVWILYWSKISGYSRQLEARSGSTVAAAPTPPWAQPPQSFGAGSQATPESSATPPGGQTQAATRYCSTCGNPLRNGERFCANCGSPVA